MGVLATTPRESLVTVTEPSAHVYRRHLEPTLVAASVEARQSSLSRTPGLRASPESIGREADESEPIK